MKNIMREFIYINENSLSDEICDKIVEYFESNPEKQYEGALGITLSQETVIEKSIKRTIDFDLKENTFNPNEKNIFHNLVKEIKWNLNEYYKKLDPDNNIFFFDLIHKNISILGFLIHKYIKNEGVFSYHNDFTIDEKNNKYRLMNFIWYLNDVDEGGETEFFGNYKIKPKKGKFVIFPSEIFFPHTGKVPISNDKYVISGWLYIDI
jgi:hypothetical protein